MSRGTILSKRSGPLLSIRSGRTMMTANSTEVEGDVFRHEYLRLSTDIQASTHSKENFENAYSSDKVAYDNDKERADARRSILEGRAQYLEKRRSALTDTDVFLAEQKRNQATTTLEALNREITSLAADLDRCRAEYSKVMDQYHSIQVPPNDIPLYQKALSRLQNGLREQSSRIFEMEEAASRNLPIHTELVETEKSLITIRDELEAKGRPLEDKKLELIRILTEPIDQLEDETFVNEIENENNRAQGALERLEADEETHFLGSLREIVVQVEEETLKRRTQVEKRKAVLEEQKRFAERRKKDYEKKLRRQQESLENLRRKTEEARLARASKEEHEEEVTEDDSRIITEEERTERLRKLESEKQEALDTVLKEIEKMETGFQNDRNVKEQRWNRKMARIGKYTKRITKKDGLRLKISEQEEGILELQQKKLTFDQQIAQLSRRKLVSVNFHRRLAQDKRDALAQDADLDGTQTAIAERRKRSLERKRDIGIFESEIIHRLNDVAEHEKVVMALEGEIETLRIKADELLDEMTTEIHGIDDVVEGLRELIARNRSDDSDNDD